jgi:hypothetical protein
MKYCILIAFVLISTYDAFTQNAILRGRIYLQKKGVAQKQPMPAGASVFIPGVASGNTDDNGLVSLTLYNCASCKEGKTLLVRVNSRFGWAEQNITIPTDPQQTFTMEVVENNTLLLTGTIKDKINGRFLPHIRVSALVQNMPAIPSVETNQDGIFQMPINIEGIGSLQAITLNLSDNEKKYKNYEKVCYINQYEPVKIELEPEVPSIDPVVSARALAIAEILGNLRQLNSRLGLTAHALQLSDDNAFSFRFDSILKKVAPKFLPDHRSNYHKLLLRSDLSGLQHALNAYPMQSFGVALSQAFVDGNIKEDAEWAKKYMDQLAEYQWAERNFLGIWESLAVSDDTCMAQVERLTANWITIQNNAALYNLYALRLLKILDITPEKAEELKFLNNLLLRKPLNQSEYEQNLLKNTEELTLNVLRKTQIEKRLKKCRDRRIDDLGKIIEKLIPKPEEKPDTIVKKAIILRKLGHKDLAVKAFVLYGEKVSTTDSMANDYVKTALKLTEYFEDPDIEGGAYVASMMPGSNILQSEIQKGDIIFAIQDYTVPNVDGLTEALAKIPIHTPFNVDVLRFDPETKTFKKLRFLMKEKPFGAYFLTM